MRWKPRPSLIFATSALLLSLALLTALCILWWRSYRNDEGFESYRAWADGRWICSVIDSLQWGNGAITFERNTLREQAVSADRAQQSVVAEQQLVASSGPWFQNDPDFLRRSQILPAYCIINRWGFYLVWRSDPLPIGHPTYFGHDGVGLPFWFLVMLMTLFAGYCLYRVLASLRNKIGQLCQRCGYDLRATPDRCPECGMAIGLPLRRLL
jgi:hypothetical protein